MLFMRRFERSLFVLYLLIVFSVISFPVVALEVENNPNTVKSSAEIKAAVNDKETNVKEVNVKETNVKETNAHKINQSIDHASGEYLTQLVVGLLIVLLSIIVLAWIAKRMNRFKAASLGIIQVLGGVSMGTRERLVIVQVGTEQILLGISPGRINKLHVLAENLDTNSDSEKTGDTFAEKLAAVISRRST